MVQEKVIVDLTEHILDLCTPVKIILFSKKYNVEGELTSFKLCVVVKDDVDTDEVECTLYLQLECENPFDVIIYKESEWNTIALEEDSFAAKIQRSGAVLYEL